jgi:predicted nucleic acid-binding protein
MRLVVDANVLISALLRDNAVRDALRLTSDTVLTPRYAFEEIKTHREEISRRSDLPADGLDQLLEEMEHSLVNTIENEQARQNIEKADEEMRDIDPDDSVFVSTAIGLGGTVVSNDQHFEEQELVPHIWTSEFVERALDASGDEPVN